MTDNPPVMAAPCQPPLHKGAKGYARPPTTPVETAALGGLCGRLWEPPLRRARRFARRGAPVCAPEYTSSVCPAGSHLPPRGRLLGFPSGEAVERSETDEGGRESTSQSALRLTALLKESLFSLPWRGGAERSEAERCPMGRRGRPVQKTKTQRLTIGSAAALFPVSNPR